MLRYSLILLLPLLISCTDDTKYQSEFRGAWTLETRTSPDGKKQSAPEISGLLEWFPTSQTRAHVSLSLSDDKSNIQVVESFYELSGEGFSRQDRLHKKTATTEFGSSQSSGQILTNGKKVTLVHTDGSKFAFEGAALTLMHKNGTVETWKRIRDQKGTLAK